MNGSQHIWILTGISFLLTSGAVAGILLQNVALNKKASQSSEIPHSPLGAGAAVDGNKDAAMGKGSCTHTSNESNPWWRVDLEQQYKITAVTITNRDTLGSRLNGAEIWIGDSIATNDPKGIRCAVISSIPDGRTSYFPCNAAAGRYVTVLLPGNQMILSLCEVEVFPANFVYALPNVALKGTATQISTHLNYSASRANDGIRNSYFHAGSCCHPIGDITDPWWRVDLKRTYIISSIKVTNRGDYRPHRLDGAEIRIGNSLENNGNDNTRCATISHIGGGKTVTFHCDGGSMDGRFVNILLPGVRKTLTLCEVEVYGSPAVEALEDVTFKKPTAQSSSVSSLGSASNAISGCRRGSYVEGCCSHTNFQYQPWWRVDLLAVHKVHAVAISSRRDCCSEELRFAQIRIGNSLTSSNPICATISSPVGPSAHTFDCTGMEGRYVQVIYPSHSDLTLCDVQVFATLADVTGPAPPYEPPTEPPLPPSVSVELIGRNVTVVGERLCWSDALFFCRRHHWDLLSLRSQEEQKEVELLLGSSPFPVSDHVWLGLRRYLMGDRWFWMSGDNMKFTNWQRGVAPHQGSSPCGGMATGGPGGPGGPSLWGDRPCDESLNFICQSGAETGSQRVYYSSSIVPFTPE